MQRFQSITYLIRNPKLIALAISEAKIQAGQSMLDTKIKGFGVELFLRPSSATGGLVVWTRKGTGKSVISWT